MTNQHSKHINANLFQAKKQQRISQMDVDGDIDLISQFRSMRTNDKENLIDEFRRLSNTQLTNEGCMFYLDLANW